MTTPRDAIAWLSERLHRSWIGNDGYLVEPSRREIEAATALDALQARVKELEAERDRALDMLGDVPGETLQDRLNRFVGYYIGVQGEFEKRNEIATRAEQERDTELQTLNDNGIGSLVVALRRQLALAQQERDEAYERLKPFAAQFDLNHCYDWKDDDAMEIAIKDLRAANDLVSRLAAGTEKEKKE